MESIKQFSISQSFVYQDMLDEAVETILEAQAELGPLESTPADTLEVTILRKLKEANASFAPTLTIQPLNAESFAERGLVPAAGITSWLESHRFYLAHVPVTLRPIPGWLFTRLECWVGFDDPAVKIHAICPSNSWINVVTKQMAVTLGLDESLTFKAQFGLPSVATDVAGMEVAGAAEAGVGVEAAGKLSYVFGPFTYQIWRPQTLAVGQENAEAFWQLDGADQVQKQEPYLALVLRVPKAVETLSASGELIAYHDYNRLGAERRDWWTRLRKKVKAFISGGIPYENTGRWSDILADVN